MLVCVSLCAFRLSVLAYILIRNNIQTFNHSTLFGKQSLISNVNAYGRSTWEPHYSSYIITTCEFLYKRTGNMYTLGIAGVPRMPTQH